MKRAPICAYKAASCAAAAASVSPLSVSSCSLCVRAAPPSLMSTWQAGWAKAAAAPAVGMPPSRAGAAAVAEAAERRAAGRAAMHGELPRALDGLCEFSCALLGVWLVLQARGLSATRGTPAPAAAGATMQLGASMAQVQVIETNDALIALRARLDDGPPPCRLERSAVVFRPRLVQTQPNLIPSIQLWWCCSLGREPQVRVDGCEC